MALQNLGVVRKPSTDRRWHALSMFFSFQGAEGLLAGASQLNAPADEYGNDSRVEALWAMKAMEHAEVYFNVSVDLPEQLVTIWLVNKRSFCFLDPLLRRPQDDSPVERSRRRHQRKVPRDLSRPQRAEA